MSYGSYCPICQYPKPCGRWCEDEAERGGWVRYCKPTCKTADMERHGRDKDECSEMWECRRCHRREWRKVMDGRHATHYESIPHNPCYDPDRCDCECVGCKRAWVVWLIDRRKGVRP